MMIVGIILGVFVALIILYLIFSFALLKPIFGKRWDPNGIVKYYTIEEFAGLTATPFQMLYRKKKLRGFFYAYPECNSHQLLVFAHGMWGSHKAYLQEIEALCRAGWQVLGFDYYGTDLSEGKTLRGLGSSLACLDAVIKELKNIYPEKKVFVFGHSWGGFAAGGIAKYHPNLGGIVSMSGFVSLSRAYRSLLPKWMWFLIPGLQFLDFIKCGKYSYVNTKRVLQKTTVSTLILHSKDDKMVHFTKNACYLQQKLHNPNVQFVIVEGKNHNPDYSLEAIAYTKEVYAKKSELSKEEWQSYFVHVNFHKMGELDEKVISQIIDFLKKK